MTAMPPLTTPRCIFVAGATGFLGTSVVYSLLETGVQVTALVPPDVSLRLGHLGDRVRLVEGDAWNRGSLTGRSRGHDTVIHLIGSIRQQPERGLSFHHLNVDSLKNITRMAIGDGVRRLLYVSAAWAPWLQPAYISSKREAERYLQRSGINWTIIRAPLVYPRRPISATITTITGLLSAFPLVGCPLARWSPLPVDIAARGIAQLALDTQAADHIFYGHDLWRKNLIGMKTRIPLQPAAAPAPAAAPMLDHDEDSPFGWLP